MKNNSIKSNYTIDEINWKLYPRGTLEERDALNDAFLGILGKR